MTNLIATSTGDIIEYSWSLDFNLSWTWNIEKYHLELFKFYDNSIYVNYDTFTFLIVTIIIWILLMKSLIKITIVFFNYGFNIVTWYKLWK